jgi:RimJ/RimL family protein N-acetyltransferase
MPDADPVTGLPVGEPVTVRPLPNLLRVPLRGRHVTLDALTAADADALFDVAQGPGTQGLWQYLREPPCPDLDAFRAQIAAKAASAADPLFFAIRRDGAALGHAALLRIESTHRVIEIGHLLFAPPLQRTPAATEAIRLLLGHVFDTLGMRRCEWKCDALNAPSRRAAARFGFTYEGTFRQHMVIKGRTRDTAWFAMLDHEWPRARAAFDAWLDPGNFNADGGQRRGLATLRESL